MLPLASVETLPSMLPFLTMLPTSPLPSLLLFTSSGKWISNFISMMSFLFIADPTTQMGARRVQDGNHSIHQWPHCWARSLAHKCSIKYLVNKFSDLNTQYSKSRSAGRLKWVNYCKVFRKFSLMFIKWSGADHMQCTRPDLEETSTIGNYYYWVVIIVYPV